MSTVKATQYLQALDAARCNAEWDQVPELCRKVQKHSPGKKCLSVAALTEAQLRPIPRPPLGSSKAIITAYNLTLNGLQGELQDELNRHLHPPSKPPGPSGGGQSAVTILEDILQARIVIAWIYSLKEEWSDVLEIVPGEDEVGEGWSDSPGGRMNYMAIMGIKSLVLKGLALSFTNTDHSHPLQVYRAATRLLASFDSQIRSFPTFLIWAEKAISLYAISSYRVWLEDHAPPSSPTLCTPPSSPTKQPSSGHGSIAQEEEQTVGVAIDKAIVDETAVASAFRSFHNFINGASATSLDAGVVTPSRLNTAGRKLTTEKEAERRDVYRYYFKFLSLLLLPKSHPDRPLTEHLSPNQSNSSDNAISMVSSSPSNRKGNTSKTGTTRQLQEELEEITAVYESYLMGDLNFPKADEYHEMVGEWVDQVMENWHIAGGSGEDAAPVVEILYRASRKTFHSPRILRYLFYTLTATGNFQDAHAALTTYLDLNEKAKERIAKGHHEKDIDSDSIIFQTGVEGIRVLCKFAGNGLQALDVAAKIERWMLEWSVRNKDILAEAYRGIGMANAAFSRQTLEAGARPSIQQEAVQAFKKGLSYNPTDVQAWFGLALIEADVRNVEDAMQSSRKGLGALKYNFIDNEYQDNIDRNTRDYKRHAVPLLHLLALLMTANGDFENAEKVCRNAFDIVGEGREAVSDLGVNDKVAIFELMMTQLAIVEAVEDSETAIRMADQLLGLYGMLFDGTYLVQKLQVGNSDNHVGDSPRPTTRASRRSKIFGISHKKQYSSSYTNLPPQNRTDESPPSMNGTIKRRPKSGHQSLGLPTGMSSPAGNAPKIHIIDANGGPSIPSSEKSYHKLRPSSVSGGTMRKMRSLGSMRLRKELRLDEPPTPPLPSSTEASSLSFNSPTASVGDGDSKGPQLFNMLKNKLHHHKMHQVHQGYESATASAVSVPLDTIPADTPVESQGESMRIETVPSNLPQNRLLFPLGVLGRTIEEGESSRNFVRRPIQFPEPKLAIDEERKQVLGALRKAWICVSGLYRRAGFFNDAFMASEEASTLIGKDGDGEADVLAERGFQALAQGRMTLAANLFEQAISIDYDHPQAIIGLSKLLLGAYDVDLSPQNLQSWSSSPDTKSDTDTSVLKTGSFDDCQAYFDKIASRDRALGLLEKLVGSPRGWDLSEGWFLLADALEKSGEVTRAKCAFWKVVELEDRTGVRKWSSCGVGIV